MMLAAHPSLSDDDRRVIDAGRWFSTLPEALRDDILARCTVRRVPDGTTLSVRGQPAEEWGCVLKGAVRLSSLSLAGKQIALTYIEPGVWFGELPLIDGLPHSHNGHAHGETTLCSMRKNDFFTLLDRHPSLYRALLQLNCRRIRLLFDMVEDLNTLPLSARLAKQILSLARSYGVQEGNETRIGLQLAQEDIAQLLGASRQRVNQELKGFEREGAVRIEPTRLVVLSREKLMTIATNA